MRAVSSITSRANPFPGVHGRRASRYGPDEPPSFRALHPGQAAPISTRWRTEPPGPRPSCAQITQFGTQVRRLHQRRSADHIGGYWTLCRKGVSRCVSVRGHVTERAVIHGGMVDDRFAVAAVGRRSLEHWRGSGRPWLLSLHRVLGRGLVRLAANGPPVHGCLAFAMSAARMRLSGPAAGVHGPELRPAAARTTREAGGDAAYRAGWAGSSSWAGLPRSRRRTSISTESSRRPRPRSWPRR